ncbi:MAG: hypothetical protein U0270_07285 [Labilithrix sp.]
MNRGHVFASILVSACLLAPSVAAAGDAEGGAAAAESLFQEGRKAMDAKRYSDACPKFLASQKLAPAIGTLLNLADCYEKNNQLASAWARFHEAIALAQRQNRPNREQTAKERADKLEPRLIKLSILSRSSGIEVKLDGNVIDSAALGTPIPVDAGKHALEASAKGKKTYNTSVEVSEKNKAPTVEIPPLEDAPPDPNANNQNGNKIEPPKERPKGWSTQKTLGLVVAGAGVVGLGVGGFFGLKTQSTWNASKPHCPNLECTDQEGVQLATDAKNYGTIATISTIAGGVLLIGGAVLFLTGGDSSGAAKNDRGLPVRVGIGPGSVVLGGSFQ